MPNQKTFFPRQVVEAGGNRWDWALLPLVLGIIVVMAFGAREMVTPYQLGVELPISLDIAYLPYYLLRTTLRMSSAPLTLTPKLNSGKGRCGSVSSPRPPGTVISWLAAR